MILFERFLKLFPALLAGSLALVYVLGAIVTGSEFAGAGVDPSDAVPLLSVEQMLARGIGVLVELSALLIGAMLLLSIAIAVAMHIANQRFDSRAQGRENTSGEEGTKSEIRGVLRKILRYQAYLMMGLLFIGAFVAPFERVSGLVPLFAMPIALVALSRATEPRKWAPAIMIVMGISYVLSLGIIAYTDPEPLPAAKLHLISGQEPDGAFLTHSNSTWYLYDSKSREILAFPDQGVRKADIGSRPADSGDGGRIGVYAWETAAGLFPF